MDINSLWIELSKFLRIIDQAGMRMIQIFLYLIQLLQYLLKRVSVQRLMNVFLDISYSSNEAIQPYIQQSNLVPEITTSSQIIQEKVKNKTSKGDKYRWSQVQNIRYVKFLAKRGNLFSLSFKERKKIQINKKMSLAVKTRTASQCHTHHQKMMIKFQSIEKIIENYLTSTRDPKIQKQAQNLIVKNSQEESIGESVFFRPQEMLLQKWFFNDNSIVFQPIEQCDSALQYYDYLI